MCYLNAVLDMNFPIFGVWGWRTHIFVCFDTFFSHLCMQAALYQTEFRPVPLEEYVKVGNTIYNKKMEIIRTIPKAADLGGKDPDHVVELCNEVGTFYIRSLSLSLDAFWC